MENKQQKVKSSTNPIVIILIFIALIILLLATCLPGYISIQQRTWSYEKPPIIFYNLSKDFSISKKGIHLTYYYKKELSQQFYRFKSVYGFNEAKEPFFSILTTLLKDELPKYKENIDTLKIFSHLRSAINDKLWSQFSIKEPRAILKELVVYLKKRTYTELLQYYSYRGEIDTAIKGKSGEIYHINILSFTVDSREMTKELNVEVTMQYNETFPVALDPFRDRFIIIPNDSIIE